MKSLKEGDTAGKSAAEDLLTATVSGAIIAQQKIGVELEGKQKILQLNKKLTTEEELFRSTMLTGLNNLSDAFVDLAFTGKTSFGDMVNAMLLDLAKLEMRMALMKGLEGVGGTRGLFNGFMSLFNEAPSGANPMQLDPSQRAPAVVVPSAMGTAWDSGIQKFAMGASFTNSIVDSPTMFKFAQGTGLMGEAGPEAIMPLKRDANGNLGVRGAESGNQVNVVVNNYSKETATTNETIDSRGQRRIEVTIGNMVAGEIARGGSSAQNSIRGTFGQQPQLLRR
jgi:phage-related minor tail protein